MTKTDVRTMEEIMNDQYDERCLSRKLELAIEGVNQSIRDAFAGSHVFRASLRRERERMSS